MADDQIEGSSLDDRSDDGPLDSGDAVTAGEREESPRTSDGPPTTESSADLLRRTKTDPVKSHLLLAPYYPPAGSQKKMN